MSICGTLIHLYHNDILQKAIHSQKDKASQYRIRDNLKTTPQILKTITPTPGCRLAASSGPRWADYQQRDFSGN